MDNYHAYMLTLELYTVAIYGLPNGKCKFFTLMAEISGVPNDHFWQNCSYNVVTTIRMFLRQSSLIFNFLGKKIPALHCQRARVSGNKTPSQPSCETAFNQPAYFKMRNDTYCQPAHKGLWSLPASVGVRYEPASKVSIDNCRRYYKHQ